MVEGEEQRRITHLDLRNEPQFPMVFVRESTCFAKDDLAIFPPINHENLYVNGLESPSVSSSSSSSSSRLSDSSFSPSDSDEQFQFRRKSHSQPSEDVGKSPWKSVIEIDIIQEIVSVPSQRLSGHFIRLWSYSFGGGSVTELADDLKKVKSSLLISEIQSKRETRE
ncbi:unnamed protein product [Arabidopsis thaliana]|uniref:(thale cress) hypothetical protein n=1 Tax=Arabidopsis thaliana TaxID=3702 RepID=A0A7G2FHZ0_ARATH|nr:unnamed protein product [Arabidopsis thaliana]